MTQRVMHGGEAVVVQLLETDELVDADLEAEVSVDPIRAVSCNDAGPGFYESLTPRERQALCAMGF